MEAPPELRGFFLADYKISTDKGPWPVSGWVCEKNLNLALRLRDPENNRYVVDHIPTGLSVTLGKTVTRAQGAALILAVAELDWSGKDQTRLGKNGPAVIAAMDELAIDYGRGIRIKPGDSVTIDLLKMKDGESVTFRF